MAYHRRHCDPAQHRLFLLPANHRCLSARRRILHRCQRKPWRQGRAPGRRGAHDRLRAHRGRRHLRRSGRTGFRGAFAAKPDASPVPDHPDPHHRHQSARHAGDGRCLSPSDIHIHCLPAGAHRPWTVQNFCCGRPSDSTGDAPEAGRSYRSRECLASVAHLFQRLHRDDRRRGGKQWRYGISRAHRQIRQTDPDHHHRNPHRDAIRHRLSRPSVWHRGDRSGEARVRQRALSAAGCGDWPRRVLLAQHRLNSRGAVAVGEHGVCRFSSPCARDRTKRLPATRFRHPWTASGVSARCICSRPAHRCSAHHIPASPTA